jgi:hypothetical protein
MRGRAHALVVVSCVVLPARSRCVCGPCTCIIAPAVFTSAVVRDVTTLAAVLMRSVFRREALCTSHRSRVGGCPSAGRRQMSSDQGKVCCWLRAVPGINP